MPNPAQATPLIFGNTSGLIIPSGTPITKANVLVIVQRLQQSITTLQATVNTLSIQAIALANGGSSTGLDLDGCYKNLQKFRNDIDWVNNYIPIITNQLTVPG